ncbi:hypothetical protein, partial [Streptomyces sp. HG99]|uniref:hypothetical protein n=1 Tax=Streptomyces sp. HG99 TaxID=1958787 RepID=UPI000C508320
ASRKACIDAWAEAVRSHPDHWDPAEGEEPEECAGFSGDRDNFISLYVLGRDKAVREKMERMQQDAEEAASEAASKSPQP